MKVKTERVIAEQDGKRWLVMWPDGSVESLTKTEVLRSVRARRGESDMLVTEIEWRR